MVNSDSSLEKQRLRGGLLRGALTALVALALINAACIPVSQPKLQNSQANFTQRICSVNLSELAGAGTDSEKTIVVYDEHGQMVEAYPGDSINYSLNDRPPTGDEQAVNQEIDFTEEVPTIQNQSITTTNIPYYGLPSVGDIWDDPTLAVEHVRRNIWNTWGRYDQALKHALPVTKQLVPDGTCVGVVQIAP
jgi:hypothetical protein